MKFLDTTFPVSCLLVVSVALASGSTTESSKCRPECPSDEALFPNPRDYASYFQCAFGIPYLQQCPEGQWYDGPNERCDFEENVECNADPDAPCVAVTVPTADPSETTTLGSGSTTTDGGEDCVPPCPSDEALYPNPRDCSTFFQCAFGIPYLQQCPEGQWYDAANERCDFQENVECNADPDAPCVAVTVPTADPSETTTLGSGSTTTDGGEDCVPPCPSDEALYPNPRDCSTFFQCAFGIPYLQQCPEGQWYDAANERCDFQENVECNADPDAPCVAITVPTAEPSVTTTVGPGSTTTDGGEDCVPPCPSDEAMYPNPRDCGSFFQCSFGVPYLMKCPPGQHYAPALERCDYPEVAECTAGPDSPCVAVTNPPQFVNEF